MNTPNVIYIGATVWSEEPVKEWPVYFSEEAVRSLLKEEYQQANNIIRFASRMKNTIDDDLIGVEQSIEAAIKKLKGGAE